MKWESHVFKPLSLSLPLSLSYYLYLSLLVWDGDEKRALDREWVAGEQAIVGLSTSLTPNFLFIPQQHPIMISSFLLEPFASFKIEPCCSKFTDPG